MIFSIFTIILGNLKYSKEKCSNSMEKKKRREADSGTCDLENEEIPRGIRVRP